MFVKNDLKILDLAEKEIDVYWLLLHEGTQSVYQLSKRLSIPRSTLYGIVNIMVQKGFLVWVPKGKGKRNVEAVQPATLRKNFHKKKQNILQAQKVISSLKSYIGLVKQEPFTTNVKYYSGVEGLEQIVWNTLSSRDKNMYGYSSWDRNKFLSKKYIDIHQKEALLRGPKDHVIVNEKRILKEDFSVILNYMEIYPLEMRYLPSKDLYISGDTYIYDNVFAIAFYKNENIFGVEIENEEFVKVQKSIFDNLWKQAKDIRRIVEEKT